MGKAKNGKEKKRMTKTHRSVLRTYMGYMNRIRSEEPELGKSLPPDKEVGTPQTLESFLFAAEVMGVLNIDEEASFNEASYENYKAELQIQAELLKEEGQWPPAGFTLPAEKQPLENEEVEKGQEQEKEREEKVEKVWKEKEEEQPTKEDKTLEPEPENQDEDENGEEQEEEMTTTHGADALVAESKQELLQPIEPEPKPAEPQALEATIPVAVEESLVPAVQPKPTLVLSLVKLKENGKDKGDKDWQGNWIHGYFRVWHPKLGCGEISSSNQRTKIWEMYRVKKDDIHESVLKVMEERTNIWNQKGRDPANVYLSTYEYFETRLFVNFIPELRGREHIAKDVKIHEPSLRAEFATKNSLKLVESKFRDYLDAKIVSVEQLIISSMKEMREDLEKFSGERSSSVPIDFEKIREAVNSLQQWREADRERRNKEGAVNLPAQFSSLKRSVEDQGKTIMAMQSQLGDKKPDEPSKDHGGIDNEDKQEKKKPTFTRGEKIFYGVLAAIGGIVLFFLL